MATICTDQITYLVKFQFSGSRGQFITTNLIKCLIECDTHDGRGIEFIKAFDSGSQKFKRISKEDVLRFHSWDTEAHEYLLNHYYFSKK